MRLRFVVSFAPSWLFPVDPFEGTRVDFKSRLTECVEPVLVLVCGVNREFRLFPWIDLLFLRPSGAREVFLVFS